MKKQLTKIMIGSILYILAFVIKSDISWFAPVLFTISYVIVGGDIVGKGL
jgi:hypothetical protein